MEHYTLKEWYIPAHDGQLDIYLVIITISRPYDKEQIHEISYQILFFFIIRIVYNQTCILFIQRQDQSLLVVPIKMATRRSFPRSLNGYRAVFFSCPTHYLSGQIT